MKYNSSFGHKEKIINLMINIFALESESEYKNTEAGLGGRASGIGGYFDSKAGPVTDWVRVEWWWHFFFQLCPLQLFYIYVLYRSSSEPLVNPR